MSTLITAMEPLDVNGDRGFALFAAAGFLLAAKAGVLEEYGVQEGSSLSDGELLLLLEKSETGRARNQALRWLGNRPYAERELYERLCTKYDAYSSAAAIAYLKDELGLLNDRSYARERAEALVARGKSGGEIRRKLYAAGVGRTVVEETMLALAPDDAGAALRLVEKSYMDALRKGQREKVMAALARRGFAHMDIRKAVALAEAALAADACAADDRLPLENESE